MDNLNQEIQLNIWQESVGHEKVIPDTLFELFEANVDKYLHRPALISEDGILSYLELDQMANRLAHLLKDKGVGPGKFVGIYLDRSIKPIISILAVLKSGAAYIPLDPSYPEDRIKYILEETSMSLMISESELANQQDVSCPVILLDDFEILNPYPESRLLLQETGSQATDLCYILFTSGTTGRPKGIMTEHHNVCSFAHSFNDVIKLNQDDRIYQGFSLGFDGSVEEMWMAFSNGASLVVSSPLAAKLPDEAARLMRENQVTVFSTVPTFLGLIEEDLPSLRLIILSGERCPESLVDLWQNDQRRILNVYGPTETTVNTTSKDCFRGKEITIGRPLAGYDTYILDDKLQPVDQGIYGELYVGGIGVSRGYYNRPDLTEKTFISNPFYEVAGGSKTIYKTGDKVCLLDNGELQFSCRLDTQVKIRGFRVEISEIESVINEAPLVKNVLVNAFKRDDGHLELAAYVIPNCKMNDFDFEEIITLLKSKLPHYMIPTYLDLLESFPMLASGKANRNDLPQPESLLVSKNQKIKEPSNEIEKILVVAWEKIFKQDAISTDADFFIDLAGYSLLAVEAVALLRKEYNVNISVRELYKAKTIEKLAISITELQKDKSSKTNENIFSAKATYFQIPKWERISCLVLQFISCLFFMIYPLLFLAAIIWFGYMVVLEAIPLAVGISFFSVLLLIGYPLHVLVCVGLKKLIIGRYKLGSYPVWGLYYFRWWFASRVQAAAGMQVFTGTPLYNVYLRLMGAKVGRRALINSPAIGAFDLFSIGKNSSIGAGTQILGSRIENGMLHIGPTTIGDNCFIGDYCCLALNTTMADNSNLEDLTLLPDNASTKQGLSYLGAPAVEGPVPLYDVSEEDQGKYRPVLFSILHLLALNVVEVIFILLFLPVLAIMGAGFYFGSWGGLAGAILFDSIFGVVIFCVGMALAKKIIMPQTPTGIFKVQSLFYVRKWMMDKIFASSVTILHPLYTTIYLPTWLRMMGAKIGKLSEISTVAKMTPDLVDIGEGSFFADGSMIGGLRLYKGHIQLKRNSIGKRSFVGNNAHLSVGKSLGDNCLLGVVSMVPAEYDTTPDNTEWLGLPSFALPYRKKVTSFDEKETFKPTLKLYIQRCFIDGMRILIPNFIGLTGFALFVGYIIFAYNNFSLLQAVALSPIIGIGIALGIFASVVALKKVLMGTYEPVVKPLWCVYVWTNELVNGVYETIIAPMLQPFLGTPFVNCLLRLMGCKIGKHTYMGTTLFSEWDMVKIGDYASINSGVIAQNHLFEDRIMKSSYVNIGDECSVGNMSIVLYDTEIKERTVIGPYSLIMKGDSLPEKSNWLGVPVSENYISA